ncbi:MAG: SDR family NAD(P)-dependent oxidoreductase [Acidobacteria bacterium]|nr:MAG: SDR family NAD(P)-dependent oxidoreductase [Acidobacteriota bacterium]
MKTETAFSLLAGGVGLVLAARAFRAGRAISFRDRVVLISGGSRGLGLLIARELAGEGAKLALLARDPDELARAAEDVASHGERPFIVQCDISERLQAEQAVKDVTAQFGRLDVLINDAGTIEVGPIEHMTISDFETSMGVHFWGPLYLTFAALPYLREQAGAARIVNISSIGGRVAVPHLVPYSTGKFALTGLSDGLRAELAKDGIRVTTVLPWLMRTGSPFNAWFKGQHRAEFTWFTLSDSLPGVSQDAQKAARRIVDACRHGDPELVTAPHARLAIIADAVFPSLMARSMAFMNWMLPAPGSGLGPEARSGWQSPSRWAPSVLTRLTERASAANNEVPR